MTPYILSILQGAVLVIQVCLLSLFLSVMLGLLGALAKSSAQPAAVFLANTYSSLVRGIPDLVLMLLIFYGGQMGLNKLQDVFGFSGGSIEIDPFVAGVLTIGFIYGAYMTETFRGAILAIPSGQMEAGMAFGMRPWQIFWRITLPQMVRLALPGLTNNWLVLMKATALVSLLGLQDMTYLAKQAGAAARGDIPNAPLLFLAFAALLYLAMTAVSMVVLGWLEKKYSVGIRGGHD